jgi:hypothetical protein
MRNWLISGVALTLVAIGAVVAVIVSSDSGEASGSDSPAASLEAFQECLAEQGVDAPAPGGGAPFGGAPPEGELPEGGLPGGGPSDEMQGAMEACAELMPAPPGGAGEDMPSGAPPIPQN